MTEDQPCRCGTSLSYADCCGVFHKGIKQPATALALMRSRFTAFVLQDSNYVLNTWTKATRPAQLDWDAERNDWQHLVIINTLRGTAKHTTGIVEFKAYYQFNRQQGLLHERSRFVKQYNRWFYVDGDIKAYGIIAETPHLGATADKHSG